MIAIRGLVAAGLAAVVMLIGAGGASAYGTDHLYQLTFSLNCDNKSSPLCGPAVFGTGGFWGWIEIDGSPGAASGTYDAQVTGCNHLTGTQAGAVHTAVADGPWAVMSSGALPPGTFTVGVDPNDRYLVPAGTGLAFPATAGHYAMSFGPGITAQAQVAVMH